MHGGHGYGLHMIWLWMEGYNEANFNQGEDVKLLLIMVAYW